MIRYIRRILVYQPGHDRVIYNQSNAMKINLVITGLLNQDAFIGRFHLLNNNGSVLSTLKQRAQFL